jgi:hypothetical protein
MHRGQRWAMMISRVLPSALSHLHPGLRLAGPARPLISVQGRGAAGTPAPVFQGAITTMPYTEPMATLRVRRYVKVRRGRVRGRSLLRQARQPGSHME